ncbi:hypothetical protein [Thalassobacillus sp. B23F22_16]|uniref:hypothetical protein n=1 Tax=Thalassobacillus sp. B23F22_16 TaxID=3459513 RepID=UPI00373EAD9F
MSSKVKILIVVIIGLLGFIFGSIELGIIVAAIVGFFYFYPMVGFENGKAKIREQSNNFHEEKEEEVELPKGKLQFPVNSYYYKGKKVKYYTTNSFEIRFDTQQFFMKGGENSYGRKAESINIPFIALVNAEVNKEEQGDYRTKIFFENSKGKETLILYCDYIYTSWEQQNNLDYCLHQIHQLINAPLKEPSIDLKDAPVIEPLKEVLELTKSFTQLDFENISSRFKDYRIEKATRDLIRVYQLDSSTSGYKTKDINGIGVTVFDKKPNNRFTFLEALNSEGNKTVYILSEVEMKNPVFILSFKCLYDLRNNYWYHDGPWKSDLVCIWQEKNA